MTSTEQHRRREIVRRFVVTAIGGDVDGFMRNIARIDWPGAWLDVFTALEWVPPILIGPHIRRAFLHAWRGDFDRDLTAPRSGPPIGSHWSLTKDLDSNPDLLVRCMRMLAVPCDDETVPVVVYRGQSLDEYQRGSHGVWWTPDPMYAEWFARNKIRAHVGPGVVVATLIPQSAVIWKLNDSEFILDPKQLGDVKCVASPPRYSAIENDRSAAYREASSHVLGLPPGYDQSAVHEWVKQGMPPDGLNRIRLLRLADLEQERAAA